MKHIDPSIINQPIQTLNFLPHELKKNFGNLLAPSICISPFRFSGWHGIKISSVS